MLRKPGYIVICDWCSKQVWTIYNRPAAAFAEAHRMGWIRKIKGPRTMKNPYVGLQCPDCQEKHEDL